MKQKRETLSSSPFWPAFLATIVFGIVLFALLTTNKPPTSQEVLSEALSNQLNEQSIYRSKTVEEGKSKQVQVTEVSFENPDSPVSRDYVKLQNNAGDSVNIVETEGVGSKEADYIRYINVQNQNSNNATQKILGRWAENKASEQQPAQFLENALFGSPLMSGGLTAQQADEIMNKLESSKAVKIQTVDTNYKEAGKKLYKYKLSLNLKEYIPIFQTYLQSIGMEESAAKLSAPSSDSFLPITVFVDPYTKKIVKVQNAQDSESAQDIYQRTSFIVPPAKPTSIKLSLEELQNAFASQQ